MKKKVAIVVLNYLNYEDTIECLHSLDSVDYANVETIVVDNASNNESLQRIHQSLVARNVSHGLISEGDIMHCGQVPHTTILVQASHNRGYACGNNLGIRVALARKAEYVLVLNNDTVVERGFLEPLVNYAEAHDKVGAVGPRILQPTGCVSPVSARRRPTSGYYFFGLGIGSILFPHNRWLQRHYYVGEDSFECPREVDILSGSCILFKADALRRIGLLDEGTFLFFEEFILHEQLRAQGLVSVVVPSSSIMHKHGHSTLRMSSRFILGVQRSSLRHYLRNHRHHSRFTVEALMIASLHPRDFLPGSFLTRVATFRRRLGSGF